MAIRSYHQVFPHNDGKIQRDEFKITNQDGAKLKDLYLASCVSSASAELCIYQSYHFFKKSGSTEFKLAHISFKLMRTSPQIWNWRKERLQLLHCQQTTLSLLVILPSMVKNPKYFHTLLLGCFLIIIILWARLCSIMSSSILIHLLSLLIGQ